MNSTKLLLLLIPAVFTVACSTTDNTDVQADLPYSFEDGFESINNEIDDLFPSDRSRWSGLQVVNPGSEENQINLDQDRVKEGKSSLRVFSNPSDNTLSKVDIEKAGFFAPAGSTITIEVDLYINSQEHLADLFLIDLECCSCWDDSVPDNQCPGIRLKLSGDEDYLSIERGKILGSSINQRQLPFPKEEWVNLRWEMTLATDDQATNRVVINDQEVISETGKNLPNREEFRSTFAANGIDFELQEPLGYERVQVGATANPTVHAVEIFVDNFKLSIE